MPKRKYIFYKVIFIISLILILGFCIFELYIFIYALPRDYPYPALGIDINNPLEAWWIDTFFNSVINGVPLILAVVEFIISRRKIKSVKNNTFTEQGESQ